MKLRPNCGEKPNANSPGKRKNSSYKPKANAVNSEDVQKPFNVPRAGETFMQTAKQVVSKTKETRTRLHYPSEKGRLTSHEAHQTKTLAR